MRSSQYRHYVTFQKPNGTRNAINEKARTYEDVFSGYVEIEPLTAFERDVAAQARSGRTHRLKCRVVPELTDAGFDATWRVLFGSRVFSIEGTIDTGERNRELVIDCVENMKRV